MGVEPQIHDFSHAMPPGKYEQYTPIQAHDRFSHNTLQPSRGICNDYKSINLAQ